MNVMKKSFPAILVMLATLTIPTLSFAYGYAHHTRSLGIMNMMLHAVVYGLVFKIFHALGLGPSLLLGVGFILLVVYRHSRNNA